MNEGSVHKALPGFLLANAQGAVVVAHRLYGLLQRSTGIVVSPGGVYAIQWPAALAAFLVLVEIKSKVAITTVDSGFHAWLLGPVQVQ